MQLLQHGAERLIRVACASTKIVSLILALVLNFAPSQASWALKENLRSAFVHFSGLFEGNQLQVFVVSDSSRGHLCPCR